MPKVKTTKKRPKFMGIGAFLRTIKKSNKPNVTIKKIKKKRPPRKPTKIA